MPKHLQSRWTKGRKRVDLVSSTQLARAKAWSAGTHPAPRSRPQLVLYLDGPQKHPCPWSNLSSELGI